jgi:hypothetical protein
VNGLLDALEPVDFPCRNPLVIEEFHYALTGKSVGIRFGSERNDRSRNREDSKAKRIVRHQK